MANIAPGIRLIVGLGNPGPRYANTRHNVGAWLLNTLAEKENQTWQHSSKFQGNHCKIIRCGHPVILFNPDTFMNCSGQAVLAIAHFYRILPQQILIAHDELDFPSGKIRLKLGGGHGGHNGLRDTVNKLSSSDFMRIRIGIGHPGNKHQVSDYVLKKPNDDDLILINQSIDKALSIIDLLITGQYEKAFLTLHSET